MIHLLKFLPGLAVLAFCAWVLLAAWETVQPLVSADFPAARLLLRQHGIKGQIEAAQVVQAHREVWLQAEVRVAPGNVQTVLVPLGPRDRRPARRK
jgi:hypothetical protein